MPPVKDALKVILTEEDTQKLWNTAVAQQLSSIFVCLYVQSPFKRSQEASGSHHLEHGKLKNMAKKKKCD